MEEIYEDEENKGSGKSASHREARFNPTSNSQTNTTNDLSGEIIKNLLDYIALLKKENRRLKEQLI